MTDSARICRNTRTAATPASGDAKADVRTWRHHAHRTDSLTNYAYNLSERSTFRRGEPPKGRTRQHLAHRRRGGRRPVLDRSSPRSATAISAARGVPRKLTRVREPSWDDRLAVEVLARPVPVIVQESPHFREQLVHDAGLGKVASVQTNRGGAGGGVAGA